MVDSRYGVPYLRRAIEVCACRGRALDVGCGSGGRLISELLEARFAVVGLDVSASMLEIARHRHPIAEFVQADICAWTPLETYELVVAWDSIFHVPYSQQRAVVQKLCCALAPGGALLFTAGGRDGEVMGEMQGQAFYYSSLDEHEYIRILKESGCPWILLERDQNPEEHIVVVATRQETTNPNAA